MAKTNCLVDDKGHQTPKIVSTTNNQLTYEIIGITDILDVKQFDIKKVTDLAPEGDEMETDKPKIHPPKHAERDEIVKKEDEGKNEVQLDMEIYTHSMSVDQEEDNENEDKVINGAFRDSDGVMEEGINNVIEDKGGGDVFSILQM